MVFFRVGVIVSFGVFGIVFECFGLVFNVFDFGMWVIVYLEENG